MDFVSRTITRSFDDCATCAAAKFKLTNCDTAAIKYTAGNLTAGVADEVGKVVTLAEYTGGWTVEAATSWGTLEPLTIVASYADCAAYTFATVPSEVPCVDCGSDQGNGSIDLYDEYSGHTAITATGGTFGEDGGGDCHWVWGGAGVYGPMTISLSSGVWGASLYVTGEGYISPDSLSVVCVGGAIVATAVFTRYTDPVVTITFTI